MVWNLTKPEVKQELELKPGRCAIVLSGSKIPKNRWNHKVVVTETYAARHSKECWPNPSLNEFWAYDQEINQEVMLNTEVVKLLDEVVDYGYIQCDLCCKFYKDLKKSK